MELYKVIDGVARVLKAIASLDSHGHLPKQHRPEAAAPCPLDSHGHLPKRETHRIKGNPYLQFGGYAPTDGIETWGGNDLIRFLYDYEFPNGYGVSVRSEGDRKGIYGVEAYEYNWGKKKEFRTIKPRDLKRCLTFEQVEMYMDRIARLPKREGVK